MAEIKRYINTDVVGGAGDGTSLANAYSSLNACEAAEQADFASAGDYAVWECYATAGTADTTAVTIDGSTTSATSYILIKASDDDRASKASYDTSKYRLTQSDASCMDISDDYVRVDGIQFGSTVTTGTGQCLEFSSLTTTNSAYYISNCRFEAVSMGGTGNGRGVYANDVDAGELYIYNCIANGFLSGSDSGFAGYYVRATNGYIYNCIAQGCYFGVRVVEGTWTAKNVASFNNTNDFDGTMTIDYCASDDGDGTNAVAPSGGDWANEFTSPTGNFTLLNTGNLYHGGADNPSGGVYTTDMDGQSYNSGAYSIGVDEYIAAGGVTIPVFVHHLKQQGVL